MMRIQFAAGLLLLLIALLLSGPAHADVTQDLAALKTTVNGQIDGGALDARQAKAAGQILKAIDKAEALSIDPTKYVKKLAAVLGKTAKAGDKGVDLEGKDSALFAALVAWVEEERSIAAAGRDLLVDEKNEAKTEKVVRKGENKFAAAKAKPTPAKQAKVFAKAFAAYRKAADLGRKFRQAEIDSGLVSLNVLSTSLDTNTTLQPGQFIAISFDVEFDISVLRNPIVQILDAMQNPMEYSVRPVPGGVEIEPILPVEAASYTLILHGRDSLTGEYVVTETGIPLQVTVTRPFNFVP